MGKMKNLMMDDVGLAMGSYFKWLCDTVDAQNQKSSYMILLKELYRKPFYSVLHNDENRAADGIDLRGALSSKEDGCCVLEMLVALAIKAEYLCGPEEGGPSQSEWFWIMLDNLGLLRFTDSEWYSHSSEEMVNQILDRFLERGYGRDGSGGLFPIQSRVRDQRRVEIWYQLSFYIEENYPQC